MWALACGLLFKPNMPDCAKRDSFEQQALGHLHELYATALRYARDEKDAEDLVQETLLRAFAAWEQFQEGTNCRAWLFRILTNNFINEYRRLRRRAARDPEGAFHELLLGDEVVAALSTLPDGFKQVVILADLKGLSYREIAEELSCPIGTVMSRLHRARRMLSLQLHDYARTQGIAVAA